MSNRSFAFILLVMVACNASDINQKRVDETLRNRLADYKLELLQKCKSEAVQRATIYTDSLVAADYFMELYGGIAFPPKPVKPDFGAPVVIKDTVKAQPIFE